MICMHMMSTEHIVILRDFIMMFVYTYNHVYYFHMTGDTNRKCNSDWSWKHR